VLEPSIHAAFLAAAVVAVALVVVCLLMPRRITDSAAPASTPA
jgi:hypothetical protein